ncbi:hypothetical protein PR048_006298, partial [Dryococelus australis]
MNHTVHESTSLTPWEVLTGTRSEVFGLNELPSPPITIGEVTTSAEERREEMLQFVKRRLEKKEYIKKKKSYPPGQLVLTLALNVGKKWLHITKNHLQLYEGPYEISRVINKTFYELKDSTTGEVVGNLNLAASRAYVTPLSPTHHLSDVFVVKASILAKISRTAPVIRNHSTEFSTFTEETSKQGTTAGLRVETSESTRRYSKRNKKN